MAGVQSEDVDQVEAVCGDVLHSALGDGIPGSAYKARPGEESDDEILSYLRK